MNQPTQQELAKVAGFIQSGFRLEKFDEEVMVTLAAMFNISRALTIDKFYEQHFGSIRKIDLFAKLVFEMADHEQCESPLARIVAAQIVTTAGLLQIKEIERAERQTEMRPAPMWRPLGKDGKVIETGISLN